MQNSDFPSAIVLARLPDVVMNNNILYRLVRPTEQGTGVISVNRLVNVVPFRRVYRFERKKELTEFCDELLRRPLVMQPVVHFGRGLGSGSLACGMCYKDDKWVMLINQTHPKILGRLQIGLDAAKNAIARGQSCEIRFDFTKMVQKIYKETLTKSEQESAAKALDLVKSYFRYAEWEYGDLIIRYHGYAAMMGRGGGLGEMSTLNLTLAFEDLWSQEISWKTLGAEYFPKPHLAPVTEDEIRETLPQWTVNGISPLENIGDQVPTANYSYSQAGRLYESFRKKKRRQRAEIGDQAEGGAPQPQPTVTDGIELKVVGDEDHLLQASRDRYANRDYHRDQEYRDQEDQRSHAQQERYNRDGYQNFPLQQQGNHIEDDGFYDGKGAKPKRGPQYDTHGHMYPEVRVSSGKTQNSISNKQYPDASVMSEQRGYGTARNQDMHDQIHAKTSQRTSGKEHYGQPSHTQDDHHYSPLRDQFTRLHMQGSDRSSHSEAGSGVADSGICSDSDGHVREGSYDKAYPQKQKLSPAHQYALDNHGFQDDETEVSDAMRKHKELIARMMGGQNPPSEKPGYKDSLQQTSASQNAGRYSDDYASRNGGLHSNYKSSVSSPNSLHGQHYDYVAAGKTHHNQAHSYSQNVQSPRQQVEESFI